MAKVIEEVIVITLSKIVRDKDEDSNVIEPKQRTLIEETIPTIIEEVLNDNTVVIEIAEK
jgi:hypothetical protein